ncbi:glycosyltransferase family 39 protein [Calycomorphotria hydatis]|uniref:glycosyltransferase family 39 protein n=1 Tax=Calycomorphotria hydatis TaxID=2528027 RepID=UPI0018D22E67|nr:glycosyltransferase family 39 protein [Calycomorphotria hydatis]
MLTWSSFNRWEILLSLVVFLIVTLQIDSGGDYPWLPEGPGLTLDESFNVQQGVRIEIGLRSWLLGHVGWKDIFGEQDDLGPNAPMGYHLPDHPPLGRYLLGIGHDLFVTFFPPAERTSPFVICAGRMGSAFAFAVTVLLVSLYTKSVSGRWAGLIAGLALVCMPRVFGHAHLAALETVMNLAYVSVVLYLAHYWTGPSISWKQGLIAGLLLGCAFLTKIQAILLPIPIGLWALWYWRQHAVLPLVIVGITAAVTFFVGWPWLWLDPVAHLQQYFGSAGDRAAVHVWYWGKQFTDRTVPWHYPFVMTLVTVPVGIQLLTAAGFCKSLFHRTVTNDAEEEKSTGLSESHRGLVLLVGCIAFPLLLFALPQTAVYDGVRLFLVIFPLLAVFAGIGFQAIADYLSQRLSTAWSFAIPGLFVVLECYQLFVMSPVWLGSYNLAIGGPAGAESCGFEVNYWADGLTREFLNDAADSLSRNDKVAVAPVLHQFQLYDLLQGTPTWRRKKIQLVEFGTPDAADARFALFFRRKADLSVKELPPPDWETISELKRHGAVIAMFCRRKADE